MVDVTAVSDTNANNGRRTAYYQQLVPVVLWLLVCGLVFAPTLSSLFEKWLEFDQSYGHGFLVLGISIWLIIRSLPIETPVDPGKPSLFILLKALVCLVGLGSATLWTLSWLTGVEFAQQLLLPAIVFSGLALLLGRKGPARMLLPAGLLYFAMPVWDYLNFPLQWITTKASEFILWAMSIEAEIYGFFVKIPQGTFEVAGGCSGLRYLLVSLLLGVLYSHLYLKSRTQIAKLIVAALAVSLITNWIRVAAIIAIGYYTDMQSPLIADHDNFGWYLFAGAMVPWFWYASQVEFAERQALGQAETAAAASGDEKKTVPMRLQGASGLFSILMALAIISVPGVTQLVHGLTTKETSYAPINLSRTLPLPGTRSAEQTTYTRIAFRFPETPRPDMNGFTQKFEGSYVGSAPERTRLTIDLYLYTREKHRAELIQYNNSLFDGRIWHRESAEPAERDGFQWLTVRHRQSGERAIVLYSYSIGGSYYRGGVGAKLGQLKSLLLEGRRDAALFYLTVPCQADDCSFARTIVASAAEDFLPDIQAAVFDAYQQSQ